MSNKENVFDYLKSNIFVSMVVLLMIGTLMQLTLGFFLVVFADLVLISLMNSNISFSLKLVAVFVSNPLLSLLVLHNKFFQDKSYYEEMIDFEIYNTYNVLDFLIDSFDDNFIILLIIYGGFVFIGKCMNSAGLKFVMVYEYDLSLIVKLFKREG